MDKNELKLFMIMADAKPHPWWEVCLFINRLTGFDRKQIDRLLKKFFEYSLIKRTYDKPYIQDDQLVLTEKGDACYRDYMMKRDPANYSYWKNFDRSPQSMEKLYPWKQSKTREKMHKMTRAQARQQIRDTLGDVPLQNLPPGYMEQYMNSDRS